MILSITLGVSRSCGQSTHSARWAVRRDCLHYRGPFSAPGSAPLPAALLITSAPAEGPAPEAQASHYNKAQPPVQARGGARLLTASVTLSASASSCAASFCWNSSSSLGWAAACCCCCCCCASRPRPPRCCCCGTSSASSSEPASSPPSSSRAFRQPPLPPPKRRREGRPPCCCSLPEEACSYGAGRAGDSAVGGHPAACRCSPCSGARRAPPPPTKCGSRSSSPPQVPPPHRPRIGYRWGRSLLLRQPWGRAQRACCPAPPPPHPRRRAHAQALQRTGR